MHILIWKPKISEGATIHSILFCFLSMYFILIYVHVHVLPTETRRECQIPLKLQLLVVVTCLMSVLESAPGLSV